MINKVILVGRLGADPESRSTQAGSAVCTLSVATSESYKDKEGKWQEKTEWHKVVAFGKVAEVAGKRAKGDLIYVEGKLSTRKYTDKAGVEKYTTEIVLDQIRVLVSTKKAESAPETRPADDEIPY